MEQRVALFVFLWSFCCCCCWTHVEGATVTVLPPTNVSLHCHNMNNTLQWTYDQLSEGLKFNVTVRSLNRKTVILTVYSTSVDLSEYSDPSNDYMVTVSAVKDGVESEAVPEDGIEYSYFKDSPATVKCKVDLPLVNITMEEKHLLFSFKHPGLLYPTTYKTRKRKSPEVQTLPDFIYHVQVMHQKEPHEYICTESTCQDKLPVHNSEKSYCLNISGNMSKMSVQATKKYCSEPLKPPGINLLAVSLSILAVVVAVLLVGGMIFLKKIKPNSFSTNALNFSSRSNPQQAQSPVTSVYSAVSVEPSSSKPLISPDQDTSNYSTSGADVMRLPLGVQDNENELLKEAGAGAGARGAQCAQEEGYTEGKFLDEGEFPSSYEPRNPAVASTDSL